MRNLSSKVLVWYLQHIKQIYLFLIVLILLCGAVELITAPIKGSAWNYFITEWLEPYLVFRFGFYLFVYVYWRMSKGKGPRYIVFPIELTMIAVPYGLISLFLSPGRHIHVLFLLCLQQTA